MSWKRRLALAGLIVLALVVVGAGILWITKPWVPEIELTEPGPRGERVVERGLFANYFRSSGGRGPAVLLLGGSEGGVGSSLTRQAVALHESGFTVLTPSYFGAPGQPKQLELVPLETFDRALRWLRARPEVDPDRVAIVGHSKGAEAALLVGTRHPELRAVIASAPSSAAWPGIDWESFRADPSWTASGEPLAVLPYGGSFLSTLTGNVGQLYEGGLEQLPQHPDAAIAVEKIRAPVLLVCGEADNLWPACVMSRQLRKRARDAGGPAVEILAYDAGGHRVFGPPLRRDDPDFADLDRWGGTESANNAARVDSWPKAVAFLRAHLSRSDGR